MANIHSCASGCGCNTCNALRTTGCGCHSCSCNTCSTLRSTGCNNCGCNSCGTATGTVYGGHSAIIDPLGATIAEAGDAETIITADCDSEALAAIRSSIPVFRDRRPELYRTDC